VLTFPLIFGWLLLRPGYSSATRGGALLLGLLSLATVIATILR
jgi:hypothetical protein